MPQTAPQLQTAEKTKSRAVPHIFAALALFIGLLCPLLFPRAGFAQGAAKDPAKGTDSTSEAVKVGLYVTDILNINFPENEVTVEFYMWMAYTRQPGGAEPHKTVRIVNANEVEMVPLGTRGAPDAQGRVSHLVRGRATLKKNWTVADYPFDDHTIRMYIEDSSQLARDVAFVPDSENSKVDPDLVLPGWQIAPLRMEAKTRKWPTTFGAPSLAGQNESSTSRVVASFKIRRPNGGADLFFKVFSGVILAIVIAFLGLLLPPGELEVRAGLMVGALFAAVGSQFTLSTFLPPSSIPTLVEALHALAFAFIGATVLVAVVTSILLSKEQDERANRVNRRAVPILLPALSLLILAVVLYYFNADLSTPPYY
jgi:hypothetical protein